MTIGTGTFFPSPGFTFPRSYVYEVAFGRYGNTLAHSTYVWTMFAPPPDPTFAVMSMYPPFWAWSSNHYSLKFLVKEFWYKPGGVGAELPLNYSLSYAMDNVHHRARLNFTWYTGDPDYELFTLPSQPPGYWAPPPLA